MDSEDGAVINVDEETEVWDLPPKRKVGHHQNHRSEYCGTPVQDRCFEHRHLAEMCRTTRVEGIQE